MPSVILSIEGETRLHWRGVVDELDAIVSEHLDRCGRFGFAPLVIARRALVEEACGVDHTLDDAALATCAIYFIANFNFQRWSGLEKLVAGCDITLNLAERFGAVDFEILAGAQ